MSFYLNLLRDGVLSGAGRTAPPRCIEQLMRIGEGDLYIGFTFPRYSARASKGLAFAKSCGAATVGITDSVNSPFYGVADVCIFAKSEMVSFVDSLVAPLSLVNAVVLAVGSRSRDSLSESSATWSACGARTMSLRPRRADAVVIGGGAAGMTTALHAAELGVDVILLEKMDLLGGTSVMAASARSGLQQAAAGQGRSLHGG